MRTQTKIIILIIILALLAIPYWRINKNSDFFVEGLMGHLGKLGVWNNQGIETALNGQITTRNLSFVPNGYQQTFNIQSMEVQTDIKKLLLSGSRELVTHVPNSSTMNMRNVTFGGNGNDLYQAVRSASFWPMVVGFLGAPGCADEDLFTYSEPQWRQLFPQAPAFNIEVTYSLIDDYHIDPLPLLEANSLSISSFASSRNAGWPRIFLHSIPLPLGSGPEVPFIVKQVAWASADPKVIHHTRIHSYFTTHAPGLKLINLLKHFYEQHTNLLLFYHPRTKTKSD